MGSEPFGRAWQPGDVVGCMIDFVENNIMFTLNGEMLISESGSELAFKEIEPGDGKQKALTGTFFQLSAGCIKVREKEGIARVVNNNGDDHHIT